MLVCLSVNDGCSGQKCRQALFEQNAFVAGRKCAPCGGDEDEAEEQDGRAVNRVVG